MKLQSVYTSSMVAWMGVELGTNNCDVWSIEWFHRGLNSASVTLDGEVMMWTRSPIRALGCEQGPACLSCLEI